MTQLMQPMKTMERLQDLFPLFVRSEQLQQR
jgi:hypothetical protein